MVSARSHLFRFSKYRPVQLGIAGLVRDTAVWKKAALRRRAALKATEASACAIQALLRAYSIAAVLSLCDASSAALRFTRSPPSKRPSNQGAAFSACCTRHFFCAGFSLAKWTALCVPFLLMSASIQLMQPAVPSMFKLFKLGSLRN